MRDFDTATKYHLLATAEQVIRDLDRWEYVYDLVEVDGAEKCLYRDHRGAPSCLIGHVLARWGVLDDVAEGDTAYNVFRRLGADEYVAEVAQRMQTSQDILRTWGEALQDGSNY